MKNFREILELYKIKSVISKSYRNSIKYWVWNTMEIKFNIRWHRKRLDQELIYYYTWDRKVLILSYGLIFLFSKRILFFKYPSNAFFSQINPTGVYLTIGFTQFFREHNKIVIICIKLIFQEIRFCMLYNITYINVLKINLIVSKDIKLILSTHI